MFSSTESTTAVARRVAKSPGRGAPAFGDLLDTRSARITRPACISAEISSAQAACSVSTRLLSASRSCPASARVSSSLAAVSPATTTDRRSRRSTSSAWATAASARSRHSAVRSCSWSCSARPISGPGFTSGRPSALLVSFCSLIAVRTAGRPPATSWSATGRCSSGRAASTALRCVLPARSRLALGRVGTSGGAGRCGRSPRPRPRGPSPSRPPSRLAPRPSRSRRRPPPRSSRSRRPPPPLAASLVVTRSVGSLAISSKRCGSLRSRLGVAIASTSMPSIVKSASAFSSSPIFVPSGSSDAAASPFGCLAPETLQVKRSSLRLVISMSSRRDMAWPLVAVGRTHGVGGAGRRSSGRRSTSTRDGLLGVVALYGAQSRQSSVSDQQISTEDVA